MSAVTPKTSLDSVMSAEMEELSKQRPNLLALLDLVMIVQTLFHDKFSQVERDHYAGLLNMQQSQVQVVVLGYSNSGRMWSLLLGAAVSTGCGVAGGYGAWKGLEDVQKMAQFGGNLVKPFEAWSQMAGDSRQATQEQNQAELKIIEQKLSNVNQDRADHERQTQAALEAGKRILELAHQFFLQFPAAST